MNSKKLYFYNLLLIFLPATSFFKLKVYLLKWCGAKIGKNVRIVSTVKILTTGTLEIGDNVWIGHDVQIIGGDAKIYIGNDCDIAPRVSFITGTHKINSLEELKVAGPGYSKDIIIGDGSWICSGAIILGGTNVKRKTVIAAGSVCHSELELENAIYGGVPCKLLRVLN